MGVAFALVAAGSVLATLLAVAQTRALEREANDIVHNTVASIRLIGQLDHAVGEQRSLVDEHIIASEVSAMEDIETKLAAVEAALSATMDAYDPWATLPGERIIWQQARADLMAIRRPIERALALSLQNRDREARDAMQPLILQLQALGQELRQLVAINDRAATESLAKFSRLRIQLTETLFGIGLGAIIATLLVGRWAGRQVAARERAIGRHSQELEERNRELDAFAGRVAHDIRGSLTSIELASTQLVTNAAREDPAAARLRRGVQRIEGLTNELLALARVQAQVRGHCDPAEVASQIREDFASAFERASGTLRVSVDRADVSCSEGLLRDALTNLTENAVKYRRPDVALEVAISGSATGGAYELRVSDNGLGMSSADAGRAFEPFYRSARTMDLAGSGLGLSIVKRVAEANGGTVSVESRLGSGSTFVVHLPLAASVESRGRKA